MPRWFNDLLRYELPIFIGKTLTTTNPTASYLPNWHIDAIAEYLEAASRGEITRLIINMPPRSLKSQCVSVAWPAWLLGHNPSARIMCASYSERLAIKHSLDCRMVMTSHWYKKLFPDTRLSSDQNEKHKFATTRRGFRFATSVGGTATGEGGNFLIIDDPMNPVQAMNQLQREFVKRWYDQTFSTRLDNKKKGTIIVVMQRLHVDDLTAHLIDKGGWEILSLPAIAEEKTLVSFGEFEFLREEGSLLHALREDEELLERAKNDLGSQAFAAQYQQQPLPEESTLMKREWLKRYDAPPENPERIVLSFDTAIKSENHHDASVCLVFAEHEKKSYLLHASVVRMEYPDLKRFCLEQAAQWCPHAILIEDKASGQQLLQDFARETSLPLIPIKTTATKITRFSAVTPLMESGRLLLPKNASWLAAFEEELLHFPGAKHDDQVDALTQYLDFMRKNGLDKLRVRTL